MTMQPGPIVRQEQPTGESDKEHGEGQADQVEAQVGEVEERARDTSEERAKQVEAILSVPDLGQMDKARGLQQMGYSAEQCHEKFGIAKSTAYAVRAKDVEPEGKPKEKGEGPREQALAPTLKDKETVVPEWLAGQVRTLYDGDERTAQVFMAGMSIPLLGIRLFAEAMKPFGDLLKLWQAGQADAARAAQGTGEQIAEKAAHEAALGVAGYFEEKKPWLAASPDPFKAMFADIMRPIFENVAKSLTPGAEGEAGAPAGFTRRKETGDD